jgi:predicted dehydrogenase
LLGDEAEIVAYRARGDQIEGLCIRACTDLDNALSKKPVAAFVCNPTSLHVPVAIAAARAGCHLFIEKPISHTREGIDELRALVCGRKLKTLIGFQFRFHPGLIAIKKLIDNRTIGQVTHVNVHWGEYLPNWHPWEDYRESYSACSDLGGGAVLTLCHPFDYLRWLMGEIGAVFALTGRQSGLEIDVEDSADILLEFESGAIGTVHLDYVQQPASHTLKIIGSAGTILWDNETGSAQCFRAGTQEWEKIDPPLGFERNALFISEVRHFLDCVAGRAEPLVSLDDGLRALEIALAVKKSAREARRVALA